MASSAILSSEEDKNLYSCCICHFQLISNIVLNQTGMKSTFVVCVLKSWRIFSTSIYLVLLWCLKAFLDLKSLSQWLQGMLIRSKWPNDLPQWGLLHECSRPPFHKLYILFALHCLWLVSKSVFTHFYHGYYPIFFKFIKISREMVRNRHRFPQLWQFRKLFCLMLGYWAESLGYELLRQRLWDGGWCLGSPRKPHTKLFDVHVFSKENNRLDSDYFFWSNHNTMNFWFALSHARRVLKNIFEYQ